MFFSDEGQAVSRLSLRKNEFVGPALDALAAGGSPASEQFLSQILAEHGAKGLLDAVALSEFVVSPTLAHALSEVRNVINAAGTWGLDAKVLPDFRKQYLKTVLTYRSGYPAVMPASAEDFAALVSFATELLLISPDKTAADFVLTAGFAGRPGEMSGEAVRQARKLVASINTHDSKAAHSYAQQEACFLMRPVASCYLSGAVLGFELGGRVSGGSLKYASWAIDLMALPIQWEGKIFTLYEAFTQSDMREFLIESGVPVTDVFLAAQLRAAYMPEMSGIVRMKVGADSRQLLISPSNSMLQATEILANAVAVKAKEKRIKQLSEVLLQKIGKDLSIPDEILSAYLHGTPAASKRAATQLVAEAKKQGVSLSLADVNIKATRSYVPRVSTVGHNPFNCGSAYCSYAGSKGPFRFPAANESSYAAKEVRDFAAKLTPAFSAWASKLVPLGSLEDKYQVGNHWLPVRQQRAILTNHATRAANRYVTQLQSFVARFQLDSADAVEFRTRTLSPIQQFVLNGAKTDPSALQAIASAGLRVLNSNEAAAHEIFIDTVMSKLAASPEAAV